MSLRCSEIFMAATVYTTMHLVWVVVCWISPFLLRTVYVTRAAAVLAGASSHVPLKARAARAARRPAERRRAVLVPSAATSFYVVWTCSDSSSFLQFFGLLLR